MSSSDPQEIRTDSQAWLHFTGVGGSGMSALAQFHAMAGGRTTGSDRAFDQNERQEIRQKLEQAGVVIVPQDGTFLDTLDGACDALVVSTAVEDSVPDVKSAKDRQVPILHRSELLAQYVTQHRTIAVTGTSGKSTVTAMVFTLLQAAGKNPGLLTGAALSALTETGHLGNAWGAGDPGDGQAPYLVIEADESDGSVVRYHPWAGVVLNLGLDHKAPAEVLTMFEAFRQNTQGPFIVARKDNLASLYPEAHLFGISANGSTPGPGTFATKLDLMPQGGMFNIETIPFSLPMPGLYNVLNATAAVAIGRQCGLSLLDMSETLADFAGVSRRFQSVGTAGEIEVIDDFAHNPDKIAAAIAAARQRTTGRVLAFFQPHGFGPTRFLRHALVDAFVESLGSRDILWMPEIYYAGGTVTKDISSADLVQDMVSQGAEARFIEDRRVIANAIAVESRPGDLVLVMGARDPSLTDFCREILEKLSQ